MQDQSIAQKAMDAGTGAAPESCGQTPEGQKGSWQAPQEESCSCGEAGGDAEAHDECNGGASQGFQGGQAPQAGVSAPGPHPSAFPGPNPGYYHQGPQPVYGQMPGAPYFAQGMYGAPQPGYGVPYPPYGPPQPGCGMPTQQGPVYAPPGPQYMGYQQFGPGQQPGPAQPQSSNHATEESSHSCDCGGDCGPGHPKHDEHKYGQFLGLVNDIANGNADASRIMAFMEGMDAQFWKGAMVGLAATLLVTNDAVKKPLSARYPEFGAAYKKNPRKTKNKPKI